MRKSILTIAGVAAALAVPALAFGAVARITHVGHLSGAAGSQVKFKEAIADDQREITSFAVRNFELSCDDGVSGSLKAAKLTGTIEISPSGAFKAKNDNGETVFKVKGQINRNKSFGSFRYFGQVPADDGVTRACDTGKLSWVTRP